MYTSEAMLESLKKVEANRAKNAALEPERMTAEQKDEVLMTYHPDYIESQFENLIIGSRGRRKRHDRHKAQDRRRQHHDG